MDTTTGIGRKVLIRFLTAIADAPDGASIRDTIGTAYEAMDRELSALGATDEYRADFASAAAEIAAEAVRSLVAERHAA